MQAKSRREYTVGFLTYESRRVLLIEKKRPEWQAGKLNGVGGKIEPGETPFRCMVREFEEETNIHVFDWREYATWEGPGYIVHFFHSATDVMWKVDHPPTDEALHWHHISALPTLPIIGNLRYLVPLAFDQSVDTTRFIEKDVWKPAEDQLH